MFVSLNGCGGEDSVLFTVGGTVFGLSDGESVVLQNNGSDDLPVSINGEFRFALPLANGAFYDVTVLTTPDNKFYLLSNKDGTVSSANITDIGVELCPLSELTELKRLTRESTPAIADLNIPMYVQAAGDLMLNVNVGNEVNGKTYLIDPLTYDHLRRGEHGTQDIRQRRL